MVRRNSGDTLLEYFKRNLKKGYAGETLKWALISQGYSRTEVQKAFEEATKELSKTAPVIKEKPKIKYEIIDENDNPITIKRPWWKFFRK